MDHRPTIDPGDAIAARLLRDAKQIPVTDSIAPTAWLRFLKHCQRTDRFFSPVSNLAWHQFVVDKVLPKDVHRKCTDYAMIWIGLAQANAVNNKNEARTTFKYMKLERIGLDVSAFYEAWSDLERSLGNVAKSNSIITQGRRRLTGQDTQQITETLQLPPATPMPSSTGTTASPLGDLLNVSTSELIRPQHPATPIVTSTNPVVPSTEPTPASSASCPSTTNNTAPIEASKTPASKPPLAKKYDWSQLSPSPEKKPIVTNSSTSKKKIRFEQEVVHKKPERQLHQVSDKENTPLLSVKSTKSSIKDPPKANVPTLVVSSDYQSVIINGNSYLVLDRVGRGGSGEVFKVVASSNQQIFALKKVKLSNSGSENLEAIRNEISLLKKLRGMTNIIELIDSQEVLSNNTIWMLFEFGEIDLAKILKNHNNQGLQINHIRTYWQQMLEAVQTIHCERVVHSDLKPANFMIVKGVLKLIDFGIACAIQSDETTHIVRHSQVGTINYMSPEAIAGPADPQTGTYKLGRPSDIWSLGCILYQMIFGKPPFHDLSFVQKIHAITDEKHKIDYSSATQLSPGILPDAIDVIKSCLCRDSSKRPTIPQLLKHQFLTAIPAQSSVSRDQVLSLVLQIKGLRLSSANMDFLEKVVNTITRQLRAGSTVDLSDFIVESQALPQ